MTWLDLRTLTMRPAAFQLPDDKNYDGAEGNLLLESCILTARYGVEETREKRHDSFL